MLTGKLFDSTDVEATRMMVGRVFKPHQLTVVGPRQRLDSAMHHVSLGEVSLNRLRYGADVRIEPDALGDFFLVQMPLKGRARIECGAQTVDSTPETASVLTATEPTRMQWSGDSDQLLVKISRSLLERTLAVQLGRPLDEAIRFSLAFPRRLSGLWMNTLAYVMEISRQESELWRHRLLTSQLEQLLAVTLLSAQPHNYSHTSPARSGSVLPRHVRKAQEFLDAHAHEPIRVEQLASVAGVSVRSLYAGFKEFSGVSPMQYLKGLRLERARAELLGGSASVATVALRWGFGHLGRFSADYRERFGESPSESLRRN